MLGLTLRRWIVIRVAREIVLRSMKLERRPVHSGRKSGELHFAVGVGACFEIEFPDSAKAIGDVDLHLCSVNRLAVGTSQGKLDRAGTRFTVHYRHALRRYWTCFRWRCRVTRLRLSEGNSCAGQSTAHKAKRSIHIGTLYERDKTQPLTALLRRCPDTNCGLFLKVCWSNAAIAATELP